MTPFLSLQYHEGQRVANQAKHTHGAKDDSVHDKCEQGAVGWRSRLFRFLMMVAVWCCVTSISHRDVTRQSHNDAVAL